MKKNRQTKVFVIGLDGATFDLIKPWVDEGKLPVFASLLKEGVWGDLESTIPPVTSPAWPSFMTGKNPAQFGLFDFIKRKKDSYSYRPVTFNDVDSLTIFEIISNHGKSVGVLNVPVTYPPRPINGFMVSGMLSPKEKYFTFPAELKHLLEKLNYRVECQVVYNGQNEKELLKDLYDLLEKRKKATLYLMNHFPWEFFMVVFRATDILQHCFWKHFKKENSKYKNVFLDFYQKLDKIIGEIIQSLKKRETCLIIMSDHGFGSLEKHVHLNNFLEKKGYLYYKRNPKTQIKYLFHRMGLNVGNIFKILSKTGLQNFIPRFSKEVKYKVLNRFITYQDIDWSRTKAYALGHIGQIFINLKGREPQGIVNPGKEYHKIREQLITDLLQLKDPEDNQLVVDRIFKKEEIYSGKYFYWAPDLILIMRNFAYTAYPVCGGSNKIFTPHQLFMSGNHRMNGVLILKGPYLKKGYQIKNARIIDLAPTILHLMKMEIPQDMDGRVLKEIFQESFLKENPIRYQPTKSFQKKSASLTPEEEERIKENLRKLGYL